MGEDQASFVMVRDPKDVAGDIPVEPYKFKPDRRNPDDDTRRIQQVTDFKRAAAAAGIDETTYTVERILIGLNNLDMVTEGGFEDDINKLRSSVRAIQAEA